METITIPRCTVHETVFVFIDHTDQNCIHFQNRLEFDSMDRIFQRLIDNNFSELQGLTVDASVPVPEQIVNEIIVAALRGNKNIRECRASISGQNKVSVNLRTAIWPLPINIKLKLQSAVDFTGSPRIRASLENNALLGQLGALFNALPAGVNIQGTQVIVDVHSFLDTPEQRKMLDLVKAVQVRTETGKVIFDIKIKVE